MTPRYLIQPMPGEVLAEVRRTGRDADWRGRSQVLRAYDRRGRIVGGRLHDGGEPEQVIAELLADPAVDRLHSRNVVYGCFMFAVVRA